MRRVAVVLAALAANACAAAPTTAPAMSPLEAHHRLAARRAAATVATRAYRSLLARSLFSRCRMLPGDSELYDLRAHRCGTVAAVYLAGARLLLEVAASPAVLPPVVHDGRVRWFHAPDACAP
jgi:hypothetical protein